MMEEISNTFNYIHSSDLHINLRLKIGTLDGNIDRKQYDKLLEDPMLKFSGIYQKEKADLMVVCQVYSEGQPLALPITTSYKAFSTKWSWNEWVELPLLFSDLSRESVLTLTVYDCVGAGITRPVGGSTIPLFGKHGTFRQGMLDLKVWPDRDADPNYPSKTPGKVKDRNKEQMQRLAKLTKKHRDGLLPKVDWSDRLAFCEIELIKEKEKKTSNFLHLMVEFPSIEVHGIPHTVVFYEQDSDDIFPFKPQVDIVTVPDHEVLQENLVESKHHKLARSIRSGVSDKDLKPNAAVRDALTTIVGYPPTTQLSTEEQDLVWKFRFYLSSQKKALTKFLKCVNWSINSENRQALELLSQWAPMDVEDALELLSGNFTQPAVRKYAVLRLQEACDEDLLLYLLQLVQALKYESVDGFKTRLKSDLETHSQSSMSLSESSAGVGNFSSNHEEFPPYFGDSGSTTGNEEVSRCDSKKIDDDGCDLASFLIERATRNTTLANYFHWYLRIECEEQESTGKEDSKIREMYLTVMRTFLQTLARLQIGDNHKKNFLRRQGLFIDNLLRIIKTVSAENANRKKKLEKLQQLLAETDKFNFTNFEPLVFPLDPTVSIRGIVPEKTTVFASALMPCRLTFLTTDNTEYLAIFKNGDDLRQDQLILQMITLMDKLLRSENLDLKLTPYRVLATSTKHGFLQFIESTTVADVLEKDGSILNYFKKYHPSENGLHGVSSHIIDNYVRSVAGYCIITYLLGVGDRHFDNLLLRTSGELFHIDFGYMLGRDPKPMPPPMKLTKEMVEAMGGEGSEHYQRFRRLCYTAFLHLRRHANLILNLFSLMVDASVPDIALEPDKAVKKVQDKFRLDLTDEEAVHYIQTLIDISLSAVMPALIEQIHKFAQFLRK